MNMCDKIARENPSFSSTLLDSIDRSIDESSSSKTTMKMKQTKFSRSECGIDPMLLNSSSTSSDSSSGGGFSISSSDSDSFYHNTSKSRPKPIRTNQVVEDNNFQGGSSSAKSKALKIYSELKKFKQPISPGAKLTSFINSLFNSGNTKKKTTKYEEKLTSPRTCSSASSFSRSCLSMRAKSSTRTTQRSVRFCLDDEDSMSRPCEQIKTHQVNEVRKPVDNNELDYKKLLNNYRKMKNEAAAAVVHEYDDDDVASYASSDLFELNHLGAISNERYLEELPVYETTHFDTNRAIANGLIL